MTSTTTPDQAAQSARSANGVERRPSLLQSVFQSRELVILGVLVLEILIFAAIDARNPGGAHFVSPNSLLGSARSVALIGIAAVGASMVIVSGGIDLSPGAVYGLSGVTFVLLLAHPFSPWIAILGAIAVGVGFGAINGSAIAFFRIPPFIVTLGTLGIARGLAFLVSGGQQLPSTTNPLDDAANNLLNTLDTHFFHKPGFIGINVGFIAMIALAIVFSIWLQSTRSGRYIVAIGGSEQVARFAGVKVETTKVLVYVLAGLLASFSGIFYVARYGGISSSQGPGDELNIIAAAVVGGVSLTGGKGSPLGAIVGALIIQVLNDGLVFNEVPQAGAQIAVGVFIILAVLIDRLVNSLRSRRTAPITGRP